jgi:hypothetical protein
MRDSLPHASFTRPWPQNRAALQSTGRPSHPPGARKKFVFGNKPNRRLLPSLAPGPTIEIAGSILTRETGTWPRISNPTAACFLFHMALCPESPQPLIALIRAHKPPAFQRSASIDKIRAAGGLSRRRKENRERKTGIEAEKPRAAVRKRVAAVLERDRFSALYSRQKSLPAGSESRLSTLPFMKPLQTGYSTLTPAEFT